MHQIVFIPVAEIYPHPENPRKDLGDLTELAESIKTKGILQNLTVVRGHVINDEEWLKLSERYRKESPEKLQDKLDEHESAGGYTVVIGHRRLAAAKLAGLKSVPCAIARMTHQEQVETMLLENMQRTDLTLLEQAQGFQMLLDFGDSVETVAEKTGFSESTIRRRVKMMELEQKKRAEAAWEHLESQCALMHDLRKNFMQRLRVTEKNKKDVIMGALHFFMSNPTYVCVEMKEVLKEALGSENCPPEETGTLTEWLEHVNGLGGKELCMVIYRMFNDDPDRLPVTNKWQRGTRLPEYREDKRLVALYYWLCTLGYEMSGMEEAIAYGTATCYKGRAEEEVNDNE
ncbi:MAG: ParB/RepB/Spo0J family partition protein [Acidaminococcaceae bacterium]|nr:ParB/RepB/Spo0J family partition protein [Acidaminococcaceae bacterium]